eukprot:1175732-Prorocentrum_minimum.AAC.2
MTGLRRGPGALPPALRPLRGPHPGPPPCPRNLPVRRASSASGGVGQDGHRHRARPPPPGSLAARHVGARGRHLSARRGRLLRGGGGGGNTTDGGAMPGSHGGAVAR